MKFKFLGAVLLAVFALASTSCKSGKGCSGGGWYGNRNLSYEVNNDKPIIIGAEISDDCISTEACDSANP